MADLFLFAFFMFGSLLILLTTYLVWTKGWNLLARFIMLGRPSLDLRICQKWKSSVDREGKTRKTPVHTVPQWFVFFLTGIPWMLITLNLLARFFTYYWGG